MTSYSYMPCITCRFGFMIVMNTHPVESTVTNIFVVRLIILLSTFITRFGLSSNVQSPLDLIPMNNIVEMGRWDEVLVDISNSFLFSS